LCVFKYLEDKSRIWTKWGSSSSYIHHSTFINSQDSQAGHTILSCFTPIYALKIFACFFKSLVLAATLFIYFYSIRADIQYLYAVDYSSSTLLVVLMASARDSNSGLPYSKPTRYCLNHAAPLFNFVKSFCLSERRGIIVSE
jgi:hypothetical protein